MAIADKFRDPILVRAIASKLHENTRPIRIMEVCGTHTMSIGKWGLRKMLPKSIELISGPGCPVCVTPAGYIDALMGLESATVCVFGDLMRVPGANGTLEDARSRGHDIRIVYSPMQALEIAQERETVFAAIGFETTIPGIAHTIKLAKTQGIGTFSVLAALKAIPPALDALLSSENIQVDGFILPGHVCAVLGMEPFRFLPEKYNVGGVITGFEPLEILSAIQQLIDMNDHPAIHNQYARVVSDRGNPHARRMIDAVLQPNDAIWRGLGTIPGSGYTLRDDYASFDASAKFGITITDEAENRGCRCGDVLKGVIKPDQCELFGAVCTPASPIGPCMVSSEGSCAAYYRYELPQTSTKDQRQC